MENFRLTYVAEDSVIGINGEFYKVEEFSVDQNIRAIQWYGETGEVEYFDGSANETIDTISDSFVSAWELGKKKSVPPNGYSVWDSASGDWVEDAELKSEQEKQQKISGAKKYLKDTDYKVLPDYDKQDGVEEIKLKRQEARELIRSLEV